MEHFNALLVNLGWASDTPLSKWVADAPRIWFTNRQATFLSETRGFVIREVKNQKNVVVSSGIDILSDAKAVNSEAIQEENSKTGYSDDPIDKPDEDEDEDEDSATDAWGFDAEEDTEDTAEVIEDEEPDSWNLDDELEDTVAMIDNLDAFPYSLSTIPGGLMEIIERLLNEGIQLQSPMSGSSRNLI